MKRRMTYVKSIGTIVCHLPSGESVELPIIPGILKHPPSTQLPRLLESPDTARKYTRLALEKCAWPILRQFPRRWLLQQLDSTPMREQRKKALHFLLD